MAEGEAAAAVLAEAAAAGGGAGRWGIVPYPLAVVSVGCGGRRRPRQRGNGSVGCGVGRFIVPHPLTVVPPGGDGVGGDGAGGDGGGGGFQVAEETRLADARLPPTGRLDDGPVEKVVRAGSVALEVRGVQRSSVVAA